MGYLPWGFTAEWEVLERRPGFAEEVVARSGYPVLFFANHTPILDLKPYLKPLAAESRSEADVRQASLKAYVQALVMHFRKKGWAASTPIREGPSFWSNSNHGCVDQAPK